MEWLKMRPWVQAPVPLPNKQTKNPFGQLKEGESVEVPSRNSKNAWNEQF
jgi:hypothetical protein